MDAGCGTGEDLQFLRKFGRCIVVDKNVEVLKKIRGPKIKSDIVDMPFDDEMFDAVVFFDVLEHVPDDKAAMKELTRVLKKGGKLFMSVPAFQFLFSTHDRYLGHIRRYNKRTLEKIFPEELKIEDSFYWNFFAFFPIAAVRLIRKFIFWIHHQKPLSDLSRLPYLVNLMLFGLLRFENVLIKKGFRFPFGVSLFVIVRKE